MLPKFSLDQVLSFVTWAVEQLPTSGWKVGNGDFNANGVPDFVFELYFKGADEPWRVVIDVPGMDVKALIRQLAEVLE